MPERVQDEREKGPERYWTPDEGYEQEASTTRLGKMRNHLKVAPKGGLFKTNSDLYVSINSRIENILNKMRKNMPIVANLVREEMTEVDEEYKLLIEDCGKYLDRSSWTKNGQIRQGMVAYVKKMAEEDRNAIATFLSEAEFSEERQRERTIGTAITNARRKKLELTRPDAEHGHASGALSTLTILKENDITDHAEMSGYFKEEETVVTNDEGIKNMVLNRMKGIQKSTPLDAASYKMICEKVKNAKNMTSLAGTINRMLTGEFASEGYKKKHPDADRAKLEKFVKDVCDAAKAAESLVTNLKAKKTGLALSEDKTVNMTNRNVATSHVAALLGLDELVAKSEKVELREPGQKKGRVGTLMETVEGNRAQDEINERKKKGTSGEAGNNMVTGKFQKELSSLQVLDFLCGQVDRHMNNYKVRLDQDGRIDGVKGFDNDMSFGDTKINGYYFGDHGRAVCDEQENLVIPHMDNELAERILALAPSALEFALTGLIDKEEIDETIKRLEKMKKAIQKARDDERKNPPVRSRFVEKDEGWNQDTLNDFMEHSGGGINGKGEANYVGRFMNKLKK